MMRKAIIFIDANNWYHNIKKWYTPSNIDICKIQDLISKEKKLDILETRWYASVPNVEYNKLKYTKHMRFLSSLKKQGIKVITRKLQRLSNKELLAKRKDFIESWNLCKVCKPIVEASFLDIADSSQKEKGIDVWIAIDMVKETIKNNIECPVLISGDADFVPAFELIRDIGKDCLSAFVPRGYSNELRQKFPYIILNKEMLNKCLKNN